MKLIFLISLLFCAGRADAQEVPSHLDFVILRTSHFDVIVNARQQELGTLYAEKLEEAYDFLDPLFTNKPERTVVVINDKTDVTNGAATPLPYSHIMIYPVLPGPSDSLGESSDWTLELLTHEFTHIVSFFPANGIMRYLRYIFGSIVVPNSLMPRWWLEGMAVHMETKVSSGGRLRSHYQDAVIRSFVKSGKLSQFTIDQANEALPSWPQGHRPYLFGSLLWSEMEKEKGEKIVDDITQRQGGRVPFFIEAPAQDNLGKSYSDEYTFMLADIQAKTKSQLQKLAEKPISHLEFLDLKSEYLDFASISPDGDYMAVVSVDETSKREIKLLQRNKSASFLEAHSFEKIESQKDSDTTPAPPDGPPTGSIERVSWFNKSLKLVYDKIDSVSRVERYSDLYLYDLKSQETNQLTVGLRAREPSVSPDDKEIAFVKLEGGRTSLGLLDVDSKSSKILWSPPIQSRISYPIFLDKNKIAFALRQPSGEEKIWIFDRATGRTEKILNDFENSRFPMKTPNGFYFTSSKNGVHNLYQANKDLTGAKPITHLDTITFSSTWDPILNDFYLATLTENGPQVGRLAAGEWQKTPSSLPVVHSLLGDRYPIKQAEPKKNVVESTENYYSSFNVMPKFWMPYFFTSSTDGSLLLGAFTQGHDPLSKHSYALSGSYHTGIKKFSGSASYLNTQLPWPVSFSTSYLTSYVVSVDNITVNAQTMLAVSPDVWKFNRDSSLEIGLITTRDEAETEKSLRNGIFATWSHSNMGAMGPGQITPESGQSEYLQVSRFFESTVEPYTQYKFGGLGYFSKRLPSRHAMMFRFNGFYVNEDILLITGANSSAFMSSPDALTSSYVMRGYLSGHFQGKRVYNLNTEYRLPLYRIYKGRGTDPYFFRVLHGSVVADGISLDGFAYNMSTHVFDRVFPGQTFWSVGAEVKLESTIAYSIPITLVLGYYVPLTPNYGPKSGLSLSLLGFSF